MVFPKKALVVCSNIDEVETLRLFLAENDYPLNRYWDKGFPSYFSENADRKIHEKTCYHLMPFVADRFDIIGWCYPEYYFGTDFENEDVSWNYISVSDYIAKVLELNGVANSVNALDVL